MSKSRIHSVLTGLPPLMLIVGLIVYYRGEQAQLAGPPILSESTSWVGSYKGISALQTLGEEKLFFWIDTPQRSRGTRITADQMRGQKAMQAPLVAGETLTLLVAPRVAGSTTYWLISFDRESGVIE